MVILRLLIFYLEKSLGHSIDIRRIFLNTIESDDTRENRSGKWYT